MTFLRVRGYIANDIPQHTTRGLVQRTTLTALIGGAVLIVAGAVWWLPTRGGPSEAGSPAGDQQPPAAVEPQDAMLEARTKGASDAPITIYEASDFQCPYCRMFWEQTLPVLEREYIATGKARLVFLNFPIVQNHPNAAAAHEFAMCAAKQDRFWPVHDLLFDHQEAWAKLEDPGRYFFDLADSVDLKDDALLTCFNEGSVRWLIQSEAQMSWEAGIRSTPSFIIEGGLLRGAAEIDAWRPILDSIYTAKTAEASTPGGDGN